jgi:isochorismate pyruvate lyase
VGLIGRRYLCVKAAARFKKDETAAAAPERFAAMLTVRREWAEAAGLDPNMVEELYRNMVTRFIAEEKNHWRSQQLAATPEVPLPGGTK